MTDGISDTTDILTRTSAVVEALLSGLPDPWTSTGDTADGSTWAVHDLDHVGQIFAGLAGSHDAAVGPWKAYMGILLRRGDPAAVAG